MNIPDTNNVGLLGCIVGATISNVRLVNVNIVGNNFAGGLVGRVDGPTYVRSTVKHCSVSGSILGYNDVGGHCGYVGTDTSIEECETETNVKGNYNVGGLVGALEWGNVSMSRSNSSTEGSEHCGGLVGHMENSSVSQSYAIGSVKGDKFVGGLVGFARSVSNSWAAVEVIGPSYHGYIGGLVGTGYVFDSFWDVEVSGRQKNSNGATRGVGATTEEMKREVLYSVNGWGNADWVIDEGVDYPRLAWENKPGKPIQDPVVPFAGSGTYLDP